MLLGDVRERSLRKAWDEVQNSDFYSRFRGRGLKSKCGVCECRKLEVAETGRVLRKEKFMLLTQLMRTYWKARVVME